MKLTNEQRELARISREYGENRRGIIELMDELLLAGHRQADVARLLCKDSTYISRRARMLGVPAREESDPLPALVDEMRAAMEAELESGERFWSGLQAQKRFGRRTGILAAARDVLIAEGLVETVVPGNAACGYRVV